MSATRPSAVCPHLFVLDANEAANFYGAAFGAVELVRNALPDGRVIFIELALGDARLLLSEESPDLHALAPSTVGGSPVMLQVEVEDVDQAVARAVAAGAVVEMPVQEMFWGERYGVLVDPFGHRWAISTAREEYSPDEVAERTPPDAAPR